MAELRKCIGSARFGIEPHKARLEDFPAQPSQKDGLGRMCKAHWNQYPASLARDAKARKAEETGPATQATAVTAAQAEPEPHRNRKGSEPTSPAAPSEDTATE